MSDGTQRRFTKEEVAQMRSELNNISTSNEANAFQAKWAIPDDVRLDDFVKRQEDSLKAVATPPQRATVGRIVHVYNPTLWLGPRPGMIVTGPMGPVETQEANVNVFLDGITDADVLAHFRARTEGNTFALIPVRDSLDDAGRTALGADCWAEFPPRV